MESSDIRDSFTQRCEKGCKSFVERQIQCLKCRVFIVVLLSVDNNLATPPGRTANHKFKWQFLVLLKEESVDFERELRASGSL